MTKIFRPPTAEPGELRVRWAKLPEDEEAHIYYAFGEGVDYSDADMLQYAFQTKRFHNSLPTFDPSILDELESRGFDLSTICFSIRKKGVK